MIRLTTAKVFESMRGLDSVSDAELLQTCVVGRGWAGATLSPASRNLKTPDRAGRRSAASVHLFRIYYFVLHMGISRLWVRSGLAGQQSGLTISLQSSSSYAVLLRPQQQAASKGAGPQRVLSTNSS